MRPDVGRNAARLAAICTRISLYLLPAAGWLVLSILFWYIPPRRIGGKDLALLTFIRFHCFVGVYACWIFTLFHHHRCRRIAVSAGGVLALGLGLLFLKYLARDVSMPERLPNFAVLWCFLSIYLITWIAGADLFYTLSRSASLTLLATGTAGILSMGNLFYSEILLVFDTAVQQSLLPLFLYGNPLVVVASAFPRYDYLRSSIFYTGSPLSTWMGSFRYPRIEYACLYYGILAVALYSVALSLRRRRSRFYKAYW